MKATTIRHTTEKTIMYMHQASKPLQYTLHHGAYSEIQLCVASTLQSLKAPTQHPFPKSQAVPAPGPGPMEVQGKYRTSFVTAFSWPTAEAREAAPSGPHSGAAAKLARSFGPRGGEDGRS